VGRDEGHRRRPLLLAGGVPWPLALEWQPVAGVAGGIVLLLMGVLSRTGAYRRWEPWYRNPNLPFYVRNLAFAMLPFGVCVLAFMIGALIGEGNKGIAAAFVGIAFLAFALGIAFMVKPPRWLKPDWIKNEEAPS
jgi:hypothetical protein